jgi:hypothetical protein
MKTTSILGALGVLVVASSMLFGGCTSAPGNSSIAATTDQKISMASKVPMSREQKARLIERIRTGHLK